MKSPRRTPASIAAYVAALPKPAQAAVRQILRTIRLAAPGAEERISYQIPAFTLDGQYLLYVAAFKNHVGVYPAPTGDAAFDALAAPYRSGKATLRFMLDEPLPLELITAVVKFRKRAMLEHARKKASAAAMILTGEVLEGIRARGDHLRLPALAAAVRQERRHTADRRRAAADSGRHRDRATRHLGRRRAAGGLRLSRGRRRRHQPAQRLRALSHRLRPAPSGSARGAPDSSGAHRRRARSPLGTPRSARRRGARGPVDATRPRGDSRSRRPPGGRPVPAGRAGAAAVQGQRPEVEGVGADREPRDRLPPVAAGPRRARGLESRPRGVT